MKNKEKKTRYEKLQSTIKVFLIFSMAIFLILSMGIISAKTDTPVADDTFKINQVIDYSKPCFNNGTYCSASAQCNYTFFFPNNTVYMDNVEATNKFSHHSYTLSFNDIGIYKVDMVCVDNGLWGSETFYAQITGSGLNENFLFLAVVLLLSFGIIVFGFGIKDGWVTIFGTFGLYFLGIYIMFNGIVDIRNQLITFPIALIILGIAGYISINSAYEMITS